MHLRSLALLALPFAWLPWSTGCGGSAGTPSDEAGADGAGPTTHSSSDGGDEAATSTPDGAALDATHSTSVEASANADDAADDATDATSSSAADAADASADGQPDARMADATANADASNDAAEDAADDASDDAQDDASDANVEVDGGPCAGQFFDPDPCPLDDGGVVCTNVYSDPSNCGACGHSCGGEACNAELCQPSVLAAGQYYPGNIIVSGDRLYWLVAGQPSGAGAVMTSLIDGGGVVALATNQSGPQFVAVDATHAYWTNCLSNGTTTTGSVMKVGLDGGDLQAVAYGGQCPQGVVVDPNYVYWADSMADTVERAPLDGGAPSLVTSALAPTGLALDGNYIYWAQEFDDAIMKTPVGGGTATTIGHTPRGLFFYIALDANNVYWATFGGLVGETPLDGGPSVTLATNQVCAAGLAVDSANVYWGANPSCNANLDPTTVGYAAIDGGGVGVVALLATAAGANNWVEGVAVDATNVYFTDYVQGSPGSVMSVPKH
jgi:hypothetical protein